MKHRIQKILMLVAGTSLLSVAVPDASAFSLLGPFDTWQVSNLNYNQGGTIIFPSRHPRDAGLGGPQNLGEEYRRSNGGLIYYACDYAFLDYFGARGAQEMDKAVKYFSDLPPFSSMSSDLSEFPLDTQRANYRAASLTLLDLKSEAMGAIMEELGVLSGQQYAWTLRFRRALPNLPCPYFDFWIVRRNFDPVTWEPSSYVNGSLYTFNLEWSCNPDIQDASEVAVDPLAFNWNAVAQSDGLTYGGYYTGLTRDDVGGLRYIYRKNNFNYEPIPANVFAGASSGSAWGIVGGSTTNVSVSGLSGTFGGPDKLRFVKVYFDALLGQTFTAVSNSYNMHLALNVPTGTSTDGAGSLNIQVQDLPVTRVATLPDFVFGASDQLDGSWSRTVPVYARSQNYVVNNGPGIMDNTTFIRFNKIGPYLQGELSPQTPFVTEGNSIPIFQWAAFDGSTNAPVLFPNGASIRELEGLILGGN